MDAKKTGILIADLRRSKGMSQTELAEQIGVTNKAISRWETGRGYPDIESLPLLAKVLGISVQELLDGERSPVAKVDDTRTVDTVCVHAGSVIGRMKKRTIVIAVCLIAIVIFRVIPLGIGYYFQLIGTSRCVVAEDYSSLMFYGEKYVPLIMDGYECEEGKCIFSEVQVEGSGFLGKLFFGDSLYQVRNVPNNDIIYLATDMDVLDSEYFVRETEYDKYHDLLKQSEFDQYYVSFWLDSGYCMDFPLTDQLYEALLSAEVNGLVEDNDYSDGSGWVYIRVYEKEKIFFRIYGEIRNAGDNDLWIPFEYVDRGELVSGYYRGDEYYLIDESLRDEIMHYYALQAE